MKNRIGFGATFALLAVAMLAGVFLQSQLSSKDEKSALAPRVATLVADQQPLPPFTLNTEDGVFDNESLQGQWTLLFFGFASCPDVCPTTLSMLSETLKQLAANNAPAPRIVFVSIDPDKDTPASARKYAAFFNADFEGVTAAEPALRELTTPLGVVFTKVPSGEDGYTMDHSTALILLDPQGHRHAIFGAPHIASDIASDLQLIMRGEP